MAWLLARRPLLSPRAAWLTMAAALALGGAALLYLTRFWDLFFYDEWGTILYRRSGGLDAFLAPHNGHLQAVVIGVYRALFPVAGLDHYLPYRMVLLVAHLSLVALLFVYLRQRIGGELALAGAVLVLMLGAGWEVVFWPINLGFVLPLIGLLVVLLAWDRPGRRWAVLRCGALLVGLGSSGLGVAVLAAAGVRASLDADRWRRAIEVLIPGALYGLWFTLYRPGATTPGPLRAIPGADPHGDLGRLDSSGDLAAAPGYVLDLAEHSASGLLALDAGAGLGLVLALGAAAAAAVVRRPHVRRAVLPPLVVLLTFWCLVALARGGLHQPGASRYLYPSAALLLMVGAELIRGIVLARAAVLALLLGTLLVVRADVVTLDRVNAAARETFAVQRAELRALADHGRRPPSYEPDHTRMPGVTSGPYSAAVRNLGFPDGTAP